MWHAHANTYVSGYRHPIAICLPNYGKRALASVEQRHPSNAPAANRKPKTSARVGNAIMKKQQNCN